jgi:dolichyl-phosphate beta-glucosyltransferase
MLSLSIVVPAYNEEERLPATLELIGRFVEGRKWRFIEVVVVDDGSTDGTTRVVDLAARRRPFIRLLRNPGNRGKGYSVRHGMTSALGRWVLFTDADLSSPIGELDTLLAAAQEHGAEVAIGSRALDPSLVEVRQSALRRLAGRTFNFITAAFTGLEFADTQCGFKLFQAHAAARVFERQRIDGFGFDVESLFIARQLGFHIVEVPVRWAHADGTKVRMFRDSMKMFLDVLLVRWYKARGCYDSSPGSAKGRAAA